MLISGEMLRLRADRVIFSFCFKVRRVFKFSSEIFVFLSGNFFVTGNFVVGILRMKCVMKERYVYKVGLC